MQPSASKRPRTPRVSRLDLPPGLFEAALDRLRERDVLLRLALCVVAAVIMWAITGAGKRPFSYRLNDTPTRTVVVRYPFSKIDTVKTQQAKDLARAQARSVYDNNQELLINLREKLKNDIVSLTQSTMLDGEKMRALWQEFQPPLEAKVPQLPPAETPAKPNASKVDASKSETKTSEPKMPEATTPQTSKPESPTTAPSTTPSPNTPASNSDSSKPSPAKAADDATKAAGPTAPMPKPAEGKATPIATASLISTATPPAGAKAPDIADKSSTTQAPGDNSTAAKTATDKPAAAGSNGATPTADKPTESQPANAAHADAKGGEAKAPVTNAPDAKTGDGKVVDVNPRDTKPAETKPAEIKPPPTPEQLLFEQFRAALVAKDSLDRYKIAVDEVFVPLIKHGLIDALPANRDGNQREIYVRTGDDVFSVFQVSEVLIGDALGNVKQALGAKIESKLVADLTFEWLKKRLDDTLTLNQESTQHSKNRAAAAIADVMINYRPGEPLADAGIPISAETLALLRLEHESEAAQPNWVERLTRTAAVMGMFVALFALCGFYIAFREPRLLTNFARFALLLTMVTLAVVLSYVVASELRAEIIPLMLFGMTIAIAYQQELAMLLSAAAALAVVFLTGFGMNSFVVLAATVSASVLLLGRIRSRRKLIYVGLSAGIASTLTSLGVNTLTGPPLSGPGVASSIALTAAWCGLWSLVAAFLMTGLLPFIENLFGVQTDLSLIELGDVAHPLLQELVRRAPGTYNHSIMVASIAEAAAEAIGAHGLLVRVGAYFHDIGKMLKPGYFVENQGMTGAGNRHDDLVPAMSTLIIIAHVKDGADLARQHHLPQPIIDFIQQHHGTTLVEYFYGRYAAEQKSQNPDRPVDESSFRYPGPKPQTKEAAVLMLADAVESASRTLVEPAPARIEGLVGDIAMKRLLDGQFDACGLTLAELHTIQDSLVKSLIAVYHGRVKYPDQRSA